MRDRRAELTPLTQSLMKDWRFVESCVPEAAQVDRRSGVFTCTLSQDEDTVDVYVKVYTYKKHPLQRLFRTGRSRREARNLLHFQALNIPAPRVIAWGEKRNFLGRIYLEFIITESIPDTMQLEDFLKAYCPDASDSASRERRLKIARQLGELTRRLHETGFVHGDLKWRNILVQENSDHDKLFWIDCPDGDFLESGPKLERKKLKDCATLDKVARLLCTKEERKTFIQSYLGDESTDASVREMCQKIESYRKKRFDPKDNLQKKHGEQ